MKLQEFGSHSQEITKSVQKGHFQEKPPSWAVLKTLKSQVSQCSQRSGTGFSTSPIIQGHLGNTWLFLMQIHSPTWSACIYDCRSTHCHLAKYISGWIHNECSCRRKMTQTITWIGCGNRTGPGQDRLEQTKIISVLSAGQPSYAMYDVCNSISVYSIHLKSFLDTAEPPEKFVHDLNMYIRISLFSISQTDRYSVLRQRAG